jgi:hypothetical protein
MKITLSSAAILLAVATPVWAQSEGDALAQRAPILEALPDAARETLAPVKEFVGGQAPGQLLATDLLGLTVHAGGTVIGMIDNVLMAESGRPLFVVVDVGEYLKTEKRIAFAFESLGYEETSDDIRLVASINPATLHEAPAFTSLADEMALHDGQSIIEGEAEPESVEQPAPSN